MSKKTLTIDEDKVKELYKTGSPEIKVILENTFGIFRVKGVRMMAFWPLPKGLGKVSTTISALPSKSGNATLEPSTLKFNPEKYPRSEACEK